MTNFEHYKEKLNNIFDRDTTFNSYDVLEEIFEKLKINKSANLPLRSYAEIFYKWGMSEYIEPYKLTQFEKDVLENLNDEYLYICKRADSVVYVELVHENGDIGTSFLHFLFPKLKFEGLENATRYSIKDILANCEVID